MDLIVNLYNLEDNLPADPRLKANGITIKRALSPDKTKVLDFVSKHFDEGWRSESEAAFGNNPTCYIAVKDKQIVGFACYDATAKGFFGPTGVDKALRGNGIGDALLRQCLTAMKYDGYGYAIIGWADNAAAFYEKTIGAVRLENSFPGIYGRLAHVD